MRELVNSLKRLYEADRINKERMLALVENKKLSIEEYEYITGGEIDVNMERT